MKKSIYFLTMLTMGFISCKNEKPTETTPANDTSVSMSETTPIQPEASPQDTILYPKKNENTDSLITILVNPDGTFGYMIESNGKRIRQEIIPSLPGNRGFATKDDAMKVAKMVKEKMDKGADLPTVTKEDLRSLGIK